MKLGFVIFLLAAAAVAMTAMAGAQNLPVQPRADVIFLNANIYTGVVDTSSFHAIERAEAMAVRDGRVEAVGRGDQIIKLKGPSDRSDRSGRAFRHARLQRRTYASGQRRFSAADG